MQFSKENLEIAAIKGSRNVADAFSKLAKTAIAVETSKVETVAFDTAISRIKPPGDHAVVVHSRVLVGAKGVAILMLSREDSLMLVDLLHNQEIGTTGILKDIDRSALKETLNILSNSFVTALAEATNIELGLGVPGIITAGRLEEIVRAMRDEKEKKTVGNESVIFETSFSAFKQKIDASLYLLFDEGIVDYIKE